MSGADQTCGEALWRCQVKLRREDGVVTIGEERVVQILGWRVVLVGMGTCVGLVGGGCGLDFLELGPRKEGMKGV